jgi:hypothetical protein
MASQWYSHHLKPQERFWVQVFVTYNQVDTILLELMQESNYGINLLYDPKPLKKIHENKVMIFKMRKLIFLKSL